MAVFRDLEREGDLTPHALRYSEPSMERQADWTTQRTRTPSKRPGAPSNRPDACRRIQPMENGESRGARDTARTEAFIDRVDRRLMLRNGILLLFVVLTPFTTSIVAAHMIDPDAGTAAVVYSGNFLFIAIAWN